MIFLAKQKVEEIIAAILPGEIEANITGNPNRTRKHTDFAGRSD